LKLKAYAKLVAAVVPLVKSGGGFNFPVIHAHSILALRSSHQAVLGFSGSNILYRPEKRCNTKEFALPLSEAHFTTQITQSGLHVLVLTVPNPTNANKHLNVLGPQITMNFLDDDDLPKAIQAISIGVRN